MNETLRATILQNLLKERGAPIAFFSWDSLCAIAPIIMMFLIIIPCLWYSDFFSFQKPDVRKILRKEYVFGMFIALFATVAYIQAETAYNAGRFRFTHHGVEQYDDALLQPYDATMKACTNDGCYVALPKDAVHLIKGDVEDSPFNGKMRLKLLPTHVGINVEVTDDDGGHIYRINGVDFLNNATPVPAISLSK